MNYYLASLELKVFGTADHESEVIFQKFKMSNIKFKKFVKCSLNIAFGVKTSKNKLELLDTIHPKVFNTITEVKAILNCV